MLTRAEKHLNFERWISKYGVCRRGKFEYFRPGLILTELYAGTDRGDDLCFLFDSAAREKQGDFYVDRNRLAGRIPWWGIFLNEAGGISYKEWAYRDAAKKESPALEEARRISAHLIREQDFYSRYFDVFKINGLID